MSKGHSAIRFDRRRNLLGAGLLLVGVLVFPSALAAQQSAAPADTAAKAAPKAEPKSAPAIKLDNAQICAMLRNAMGQMGKNGGMSKAGVQVATETAKADSSATAAKGATPANSPKADSTAHAGHTDSSKPMSGQVKIGVQGGGGQTQSFSC